MTWIKIDDRMPTHPKFVKLSCNALTLWIEALCYSSMHLTDGKVPGHSIDVLTDRFADASQRDGAIEELLSKGIFEAEGCDFRIVNYLDHQRSRKDIEAQRAAVKYRVKKHRDSAKCNAKSNALHGAVCNANVTTPEAEAEAESETAQQRARNSGFSESPPEWRDLAMAEAVRCKARNPAAYAARVLGAWAAQGGPPKVPEGKTSTAKKKRNPDDFCAKCGRYVGAGNREPIVHIVSGAKIEPRCPGCGAGLIIAGEGTA